jgi:hypothetical protein
MDVLLRNLSVCDYETYSKKKKIYVLSGTQTNIACFRRVVPGRVNLLGYLRVQQTTTLSQRPSVEAEVARHTPRKNNDLYFML